MTVPKHLTYGYVEEHRHDRELAEHLDANYFRILAEYGSEEKPEMCYAVAYCLYSYALGLPKESAYKVHRHVINVTRIGVNEFSERRGNVSVEAVHLANADIKANLLVLMAFSMFECDRPISALGYLDNAEDCIDQAREFGLYDSRSLDVQYECCRAKEAEIYLRLVPDLPPEHRPMFATVANSYLWHAVANLRGLGEADLSEHYGGFIPEASELCRRYPMRSKREVDMMNRDSLRDPYLLWCQEHYRFLNLFNEIPHRNQRYAKDDLDFELNERYRMLLDDVLHTYDHCRRIMFGISRKGLESFGRKGRDDDVETLLDCYVRAYTLLDKVSKLATHLFPRDDSKPNATFYEVAEGYERSSNPYLRAIHHVCTDVFPDRVLVSERTFDPRLNTCGVILRNGLIRNSIAHNTVDVCSSPETRAVYEGVISITPLELYHYASMLLYDVREVVLLLQLAYNRRKSQ